MYLHCFSLFQCVPQFCIVLLVHFRLPNLPHAFPFLPPMVQYIIPSCTISPQVSFIWGCKLSHLDIFGESGTMCPTEHWVHDMVRADPNPDKAGYGFNNHRWQEGQAPTEWRFCNWLVGSTTLEVKKKICGYICRWCENILVAFHVVLMNLTNLSELTLLFHTIKRHVLPYSVEHFPRKPIGNWAWSF